MLKGIDISKWQSIGTGDGDYDFIICKATEGVGYTDPNCDGHYQRAKAQGKLLGVYHVLATTAQSLRPIGLSAKFKVILARLC